MPPFDAGPVPGETPEEKQARLLAKMRADREARASIANISLDPEPEPVPAPGYRDDADTRLAPRPTPRDATASPPIVPQNTMRSKPYGVPDPSEISGSPWANFATVPSPRESAEASARTVYPGVNLGPEAGRSPVPDVAPDAAAAIQASVARHESAFGTGRLGPEDAPAPFSKPPAGGIPMPEEEDGYWERLGRGLASRGGDLASGLSQTLSDAVQASATGYGDDNFMGKALGSVAEFLQTSAASLDEIQSESYQPKYNDVEKALSEAREGRFGELFGFIAEQAPLTIADALVSVAGLPIYMAATTGDFAKERAQNDGRDPEELTSEDYAYGAGAATVSWVASKLLLGQGGKLASKFLSKETIQEIADFGTSNVFKRVVKSGFRGAASESMEEGAQQALTTVDTEKGATWKDIGLASAGGALAGGPAAMGIDLVAGQPGHRGADAGKAVGGEEDERTFREGQRIQLQIEQAIQRGASEAEILQLQKQLQQVIGVTHDVSPDAAAAIKAAAGAPPAGGRKLAGADPGRAGGGPAAPPAAEPAAPPVPSTGTGPGAVRKGDAPSPNGEEWIKRDEADYEEWRKRAGAGIQRHPGGIPEAEESAPAAPPAVPSGANTAGYDDDVYYNMVGIPESKPAPVEVEEEPEPGEVPPAPAITATGEEIAPSRSDREIREEYAPDKPVREEGETDEAYQRRLEGWHRNIEEHKAKIEEQDDEAWRQHEKARKTILKADRKAPHITTGTAAYHYLQRMTETRRAIPEEKHGRADRDELAMMYRNLSDASRVLNAQLQDYLDKPENQEKFSATEQKQLRKMANGLTTSATWMANARDDVMQFSEAPDQEPGGPRQETAFDRSYANFQVVSPDLMKGLGLPADFLTKAAIQEDPEVLHQAIVKVSEKAHAKIQKFESKSAKRKSEDTGRKPLPELPKQGKSERVRHLTESQSKLLRDAVRSRSPTRVNDALQRITYQRGGITPEVQAEIESILVEMSDVAPPAMAPPKLGSKDEPATSKTLYRDEREQILDTNTGQWEPNPNFKKRLPDLTEEQREEIRQLEEEEERYLKGKVGFYDPDKVVTAKGPTGKVNIGKLSERAERAESASIAAYADYVDAQQAFNEAQQAVVDARKGTDLTALREATAALGKAWGTRQQAGQVWLKASQAAHQASVALGERHPRVAADVAAELEAQVKAAEITVAAHEDLVTRAGGNLDQRVSYPAPGRVAALVRSDVASNRERVIAGLTKKVPALEFALDRLKQRKIEPKLKAKLIASLEERISQIKKRAKDAADVVQARIEEGASARAQLAEAWAGLDAARKDAAAVTTMATQARAEADRLSGKPIRWVFKDGRRVKAEIENLQRGQTVHVAGEAKVLEASIHYEPVTIKKRRLNDKGEVLGFDEVVLTPTNIILGKPFAIRPEEANRRHAAESTAREAQAEFDLAETTRAAQEAVAIDELAEEIRGRPRLTEKQRREAEIEEMRAIFRESYPKKKADQDHAEWEKAREEWVAGKVEDLAGRREEKVAEERAGKSEDELALEAVKKAERAAKRNKKKLEPAQQKIIEARSALDRFKRDVEAGAIPGDYARLQALAETVWNSRFDRGWLPRGLWVHDRNNEKEPYRFVHSIMPRVDSSKLKEGVQQRYTGTRHNHNGRIITVYSPLHVEPAIGWRFGMTLVSTTDSGLNRQSSFPTKRLPKLMKLFETRKVDALVSDIMKQIGVDHETARAMANVLLFRAERAGHSRPSGTRGYDKAERQARRELKGQGKARKQKEPDPGEDEADESEPVTRGNESENEQKQEGQEQEEQEEQEEHTTPTTDEQLAALLAALDKAEKGKPSDEARRSYESWVTSLKQEIATHHQDIAAAEAALPKIEAEVTQRLPENEEMAYKAPDSWPSNDTLNNYWKLKVKDGAVYNPYVALEPFQGTTDDVFHRAMMAHVRHSITIYRHDLTLLERKLADAEKRWAEGGGSHGGGGGAGGTGGGGGGIRVAPTSAGAPGYVDTGVFAPSSTESGKLVDLLLGVKREPYESDDVFNQFESFGDRGSVEGEAALTNKTLISAEQKETAAAAFHVYKQRRTLLERGGAWLTSVNRAGFLGANGTGSGKSIIMAMLAHAISHGQPQTNFKRVLIVHQDGQPNAVRNAMKSLWHNGMDPNDAERWLFIPYLELEKTAATGEEFAAIIFDEAHWTKAPSGLDKTKTYSPAAAAVKADFRAFFTATPTDAPLQEEYYLRYMMQGVDTPLTISQAEELVRDELDTNVAAGVTSAALVRKWLRPINRHKIPEYTNALARMVERAAANNAVRSYALAQRTKGTVTQIASHQINPAVTTAIENNKSAHRNVLRRLNEHAKVEAMVERTLDLIQEGRAAGEERGVINVFEFADKPEDPKHWVKGDTGGLNLDQPPILRMKALLTQRAKERGITLNVAVIKGKEGGGHTDRPTDDIADDFRAGVYNVILMTDAKGGTGINLDDNVGDKPKYMLVGGAAAIGQNWIQLMGRIDRQSTVSTPYAEWMALDSDVDRAIRDKIKVRVGIERAAVGLTGASERGEVDLSTLLDKQSRFRKRIGTEAPHSSPVDKVVSQRLSKGPVTASSLVADIARNNTDPALAELAQALVGHPALATTMVEPTVADAGVLGYAQGRTAYVNTGTGSEAITALHEVIHHVTHRAIDSNPVIRARLQAIMNVVPHELAPMFEGVLTDPHEFVATAFSDPRFQRALKGIKAPSGATLWQRFKEWVRTIIGGRDKELSAFDAVLELRLTDPGTVTEHGYGDVSTQLTTAMQRRVAAPAAVRSATSGAGDKGLQVQLALMTYDQIVDTYGKLSTDRANSKRAGGVNHLKALEDIMEARYAYVNRDRHIYDSRVLTPFQTWAQDPNGGRRMIKVRTTPDGPFESMSALQYLAVVMNESGYGKLHFGKPEGHEDNDVLHPPADPAKHARTMAKKGRDPLGRNRSHVIWDLHKKQFDTVLGQGGRDLYNSLADFFKEQVRETSTMVSRQFLDMTVPRADGRKWHTLPGPEIDAEIARLGALSDADLIELGIQRQSLKKLSAIIDPKKVKGAYFPLKRYGEWVVSVRQVVKYANEADKEEKMREFFGATDDPASKELTYYSMSRFESQNDGETFRKRLLEQFPNAKVSQVMLSSSTSIVEEAKLSETLLGAFTERVHAQQGISEGDKKAQISLFTQAMIDLMPEASFADTFRPRKGVLGASLDIFRGLNSYGSALSHYKGAAVFAAQHREALKDFQGYLNELEHGSAEDGAKARKLRRVSNELGKRAALTATAFTEQKWAQSLNNVGFGYHLVSASYNILNMSQVPLMTVPYLAGDHGMLATSAALARAYRVAGGGPLYKLAKTGFSVTALKGMFAGKDFDRKNYDVLTEMQEGLIKAGNVRHAKLLADLAERNMIDATVAMDMAAGARTSHVDAEGNLRKQSKLGYLTDWMKMAPHITEVMNRAVTAVAAYDLEFARQQRKGVSAAESSRLATEYAAKAINQTQFNYQTWNKPRILQGSGLARVLLMFKQHPQHVYYFMVNRAVRSSAGLRALISGKKLTTEEREDARAAMKQLAYFVGMHVMAAGAIGGTPEPIKWLVGLLSALFGDEDEPFDFELWVQNSMYDWLGPELGTIASRGAPAAAGVDLSSRIGIDSLLMFENPDPSTPDSFMADIFRTIGGPVAGLGERAFYLAPTAIANGEYTKAIEALTPKAIRDPIRAYRTAVEGYTTYAGRVYSEPNQIGPLEIFITSMGLNPSSTTLMYMSREVDNQVDAMQSKRTNLMRDAYFSKGDVRAFNDAFREIVRWNADNPVFAISKKDLIKHFKGRARNQVNTHGGMLVPEKYRPWADYQNRFRGIPREVTPG